MELSERELDQLGCAQYQDTCPCVPCMARRDLREAIRLMRGLISADAKGIIMSSDKIGTYHSTQAIKAFLGQPGSATGGEG